MTDIVEMWASNIESLGSELTFAIVSRLIGRLSLPQRQEVLLKAAKELRALERHQRMQRMIAMDDV